MIHPFQAVRASWDVLWGKKKTIRFEERGKGVVSPNEAQLKGEEVGKYSILRSIKKEQLGKEFVEVLHHMAAQIFDVWRGLSPDDVCLEKKMIKLQGEAHFVISLLLEIENSEHLLEVARRELEKLQDERKKGR